MVSGRQRARFGSSYPIKNIDIIGPIIKSIKAYGPTPRSHQQHCLLSYFLFLKDVAGSMSRSIFFFFFFFINIFYFL